VEFEPSLIAFREAMHVTSELCLRCESSLAVLQYIQQEEVSFPGFDTGTPEGQIEAAGWIVDLMDGFSRHIRLDPRAAEAAAEAASRRLHPSMRHGSARPDDGTVAALQASLDSITWPEHVLMVKVEAEFVQLSNEEIINVTFVTNVDLEEHQQAAMVSIVGEFLVDRTYRAVFVLVFKDDASQEEIDAIVERGAVYNYRVHDGEGGVTEFSGVGPTEFVEFHTTNGEEDDDQD
jgi:hypothetical protein